jgi:purine-binding chemotaxis protein CheW
VTPAAAAAAATAVARPVSSELRLLVAVAGGAEYALPLERVREVIPYAKPRRLASPSPWLAGVISVRGALVPVCDLRRRLGVRARAQAEAYVLVDGPDGAAALAVDRVSGLVTAVSGEVAPPVGGGIGVSGIVTAGARLLVLLELDDLLDDGRAS